MGALHINLRIKFRLLFTDIYRMDRTFQVPYAAVPVPIPLDTILFNERGIYLRAWNTDAP